MILGSDGKPLKKPNTSEIATLEKEFGSWIHFLKILPNPDPIIQKTGKGSEIYAEMRTDGHIRACLTARKAGVLSKRWDVLPAEESGDKGEEIATFVKRNLEGLNFDQDLRQMLDAPFEGFRAMEVLWEERKDQWWVKDIKSRPQRRFNFGTSGELRLITLNDFYGEPVPPAKFLLVQHEDEDDDNPYGTRLYSTCFWPWMFKKHGYKFWAIFVEKYGMPTAVGKYHPGASDRDKRELLQALVDLVQDAAVAIPSNSELDFKETSGDKSETHRLFLVFSNQEISKGILGQTLTTEIGERGSYSAASVHADVKQDIIEADAKMIMAAMNNQLVKWLVDFNFGPQEDYPRFTIFYEEEDIKKEQAERDKTLVEIGVPIGVNYFYERYNIPKPAEDEPLINKSDTSKSPTPEFAAQYKGVVLDFEEKISSRGDYLDQLFEAAMNKGATTYGKLLADIKQQINSWDDYNQATSLKPDSTAMDGIQEVLLNTVLVGYMLGEADAWQDYEDGLEEVIKNFAKKPEYTIKPEPLTLVEAVKRFKQIMPVEMEQYRKLEEELKPKYFTISRVEGEDIVTKIKGFIEESLEKGTPFQEFRKNVDELFERLGFGPSDPWHLETVFRTNIQTAYNAGNWEKMQEPEFVDMFPYYRYSSVLDSQTRPAHRAMHGFIAHRDDPIWEQWWPPNGYRCRCGVIAINKYRAKREGIKVSKPMDLLPDKGFVNNPGQALREVPESMR
jgi:SPP1 gp7 family putative phage head morphogenesis protein